jgi:hypothetical protein
MITHKKRLIAFSLFSLIIVSAFGQDEAITISAFDDNDWFKKGTSVIDLLQKGEYASLKNPENTTRYNNFELNLRGNYFVADNFGVVAGIHIDNQVTKSTTSDSKNKNNYSLFEMGGMYGWQPEFLNRTPLSAQLTFGFGGSENFSLKTGLFATQLSLSSYHPVGESGLHISPTLGYGFLNQPFKESDASAMTNGFFAGVSLVKPFSCAEYLCALDEEEAPEGLYHSGSNFLTFSQNGLFSTGATKIKDSDFKVNNTNFELRLGDYHYVLDNFAVGAAVDLDISTLNQKDFESKTTTTNFTFMPMARYNAPIEGPLNHLYADAGFGFGSSNTKNVFSGNETKTKNGVTGFEIGIGYNVPFTEELAFSIQGGYAGTTTKDQDTDIKDKRGGFSMHYGLSYKLR